MEQKAESKRTKVLRATDVIPPFDEGEVVQQDGNTTQTKVSRRAGSKQGGNGGGAEIHSVESMKSAVNGIQGAAEAFLEIPTFDLAENILAEQRRAATRRRRAPRQGDDRSFGSAEQTRPRPASPEPSADDLLELQRIVAEIVARDIARLCKRPNNLRPAL